MSTDKEQGPGMFTLGQSAGNEKVDSVVRNLQATIRASMTKEDWLTFDEQKADRARLCSLIGIARQEVQGCIDRMMKTCVVKKDKNKALLLKDAGNKVFGAGHNERALLLYSQALTLMPLDDTKDASILYANRSATLFHLGEHTLALQDVELAFSLRYPSELHYKLHERAGRCCLAQGNDVEATRRFDLALQSLLKTSGLEEGKISKMKSTLETIKKTCHSSQELTTKNRNGMTYDSSQKNVLDLKEMCVPEVDGGRSPTLHSASSRLAVESNDEEGRHIVATQDIRPGDVILVEKAYVAVVTPETYHRQCAQCFAPLRAPIPCSNCCLVSFCSPKCRDEAWATHHQHECPILGLLKHSGISIICYMAVRILTQGDPSKIQTWYDMALATEEEIKSHQESNTSSPTTKVTSTSSPSSSKKQNKKKEKATKSRNEITEYRTDYVALFHLVTHSSQRAIEDNFHRVVMALYLLLALKETTYFSTVANSLQEKKKQQNQPGECPVKNNDEGIQDGELEIILGTLLLRSLQFLQFNSHEISGWDADKFKSVFLGGGLFPTLALFNHSCNPAIVRYFVNDTVVVRTIRSLSRGEAVTENYGQQYVDTPKKNRQAVLKTRYLFDCVCIACQEDWPMYQDMKRDLVNFRCPNCRFCLGPPTDETMALLLRCAKCSRPTELFKSLKGMEDSERKYREAMRLRQEGKMSQALQLLLENIAFYDRVLIPPFRDYHFCQEAVRACILSLGNAVVTVSLETYS